ncbi:hypothetical protein [Desulfovibrio sp. ZJ369]|uniref:hypothetical protein n=1 Tax=Desulfovibrio sp. ZJ369 TaxID=2709793 RepID=UPI0013EC066F|nr:hypothetical protein [Desulfovibrio sp. ZJ369]
MRGDDSLDVADPMKVEYGKVYLLSGGGHSEEVMLRSPHDDGRIRITTNLENSYGPDSSLSRTTAHVDTAKGLVRGPGYYMTKALTFARHGLVYAEYEGSPPALEIAPATGGGAGEEFTVVSGTVQRSGLISFPFAAGEWVFRFSLTAAASIKRLVWVDQGEVSEFLARIEIEDASGLYKFRFAEFGLPATRDYVVQLTPDAASGESDGGTQGGLPKGTLLVLGGGVYPLLSGGRLLAGGPQ